MMRVGIFQTTNSMYGGSSYELMIADSLSEAHRIEWIPVQPWYRRSHRLQTMLRVAFAERVRCKDLWIRNETSLLGMVSPKLAASTIAIVHHLDDSIGSVKAWSRVLNNHWIRRARECARVVVVSRFWQEYMRQRRIHHTTIIYNGYRVGQYCNRNADVQAFRAQLGFGDRPLVYVGNCQKRKGAPAVIRALHDRGYELVTSGVSDVDVAIRKLVLPHEQYRLLLAASDLAITMSDFQEGWNRTAHEALLSGTPVIGSGRGGMEELLSGAEQVICKDIRQLPSAVCSVLADRNAIAARGRAFAQQFTFERFARAWRELTDTMGGARIGEAAS